MRGAMQLVRILLEKPKHTPYVQGQMALACLHACQDAGPKKQVSTIDLMSSFKTTKVQKSMNCLSMLESI